MLQEDICAVYYIVKNFVDRWMNKDKNHEIRIRLCDFYN